MVCATGCGAFGTESTRFVIRVDTITAPATIAPSDTLRVRFEGVIGSSGCYRLESIELTQTIKSLDIRFIGENGAGFSVLCTAAISMLDHYEAKVPPIAGPFVITVRQPDGTTLTRTVAVQ
jgi:hypothetical protein